ncbi:STAS domain-containing protein [Micromonospora sp. KC207]|uniref:STAS domain-containing protein n=1 Tax=Micromonospora sp. KC207 TaxID=2530377 RepID=UPI0010437586|nr:STAS domain-containing protein [Micromonospora sp. KC207]TDC59241.1 STAS domain-containing protein [Micromonospora sp. KC207]
MNGTAVTVETRPDGTLIIHPGGQLDADRAVELRRTIVHAVRRVRPLRLVVDLRDLHDLDAINLGTLAAACQLGDDHQVAVFLDYCCPTSAERLTAAGVPGHRLRHTAPAA